MKSLLGERFCYLLDTFEFIGDSKEISGMPSPWFPGLSFPWPISNEDVQRLYGETCMPFMGKFKLIRKVFISGSFCNVRVLVNREPSVERPEHVCDNVFLLTRKGSGDEADTDRIDYWQRRWVEGTAMWHSNKPTPHLVRHWDKLRVS